MWFYWCLYFLCCFIALLICFIIFYNYSWILNLRLEDMLYLLYLSYNYLGFFWMFCMWGFRYKFSPFTHTFHACIMSETVKPRVWKILKIEGFSDIEWDVLPTSVFMRIPIRVCSLYLFVHKLVVHQQL